MVKYTLSHQSGFTLIELMVVIAIISILASFAAPSFEKHIAKANLVDVQLYGNTVTSNVDEYLLIHSKFPDATTFNTFKPDHSSNELIKSVSLTKIDNLQGTVTISLNDDIAIQENQFIRFSRANTGQWLCDSTLADSLIPSHCNAFSQD
ncbi:pilin [Marinomonas atlantica]|uniref:pilin n=1 Tax=Marinomonas atlantica TaxID=1806668 RepID=UPI00082B7445|nr:prepilin-type N-terminal cleavage/methylation domain-containing protein [Marinomonas atlantica]MCO4786333.1 prepilin-type N-terminal cleavage/methylation domain-containing protein [Marinomonas atlantica]